MTVVVGTLCENSKAAILVADRFVGTADWKVAVPGPDCKIFPLSKHILCSFAGDTPTEDLIGRLANAASDKATVWDAARAIFREKYLFMNELRKNAALAEGIDEAAFANLMSDIKRRPQVDKIDKTLPSTEMLLIGADDSGAHLHKLKHFGPQSQNNPGFTAIGTGSALAMTAFSRTPNMKNTPLPNAVIRGLSREANRGPILQPCQPSNGHRDR